MRKLVCCGHGRIQAHYAEDDDSAPAVPGRCHDQSPLPILWVPETRIPDLPE
jgi:hypothetical protein